jgi:hypothetical protein
VFNRYLETHFYPCADISIKQGAEALNDVARCFQSQPRSEVDLVLLGDSHALHLYIGLAEALPDLNLIIYARASLPLLGGQILRVFLNIYLLKKMFVRLCLRQIGRVK